jgi:hypothetical protein
MGGRVGVRVFKAKRPSKDGRVHRFELLAGFYHLPTSLLLASTRPSQRLGRLRETFAIPLRYLTNSFNDPCSSIETTYCQDQWRHLENPKDFVMSILKFQTFYDHND